MTTRGGARIRIFRSYLVLAVALCAVAATLTAPATAAPPHQPMAAQASPATNLGDQVVDVTWQGFKPTTDDGSNQVVILQCRAQPRSVQNDCNTADTFPFDLNGNQQQGVTHADGTGSKFMDIMTTARLPSLACSETTPCSLLVYETTDNGFDPNGLPPANTRVLVPLSFARNAADCPPVREYDFKVEAEASSAPALYQWAAALCTGKHSITMSITNTASNQAREDFLSGEVDLGVTSLPPEPEELAAASPSASSFSVTPIDLSAIVLAYNIVDPVTNKQITDLTLTPRLVARLLSDSDIQSFFNDPELKKLNPHHHWPLEAADPGLRAEKSADTWIVTHWVNGNPGARAFLDGKDRYHVPVNPSWLHVKYPTDVFAARNSNGVYFPRIGEEGVAQRLFANTKPADSIPTDPLDAGEIGILDLPTAAQFRLPIAKLTNGVGQPVVTLTGTSLEAGFAAMKTSPAGFHYEPAAPSDLNAYPLAKVDQAMVPKTLTGSSKDSRIRALLDYAVGPGQANLPLGYGALPTSLELQTLHYTGDLPPPPTTTTTTPATIPEEPLGGGLIDSGGGGTGYVTPPSSPTPATTATKPTTTTSTKPVTKVPRHAQFVAMRVPGSGDGVMLPIVLGLGLLAVLASGADIVQRRGRAFVRKTRARES